MRLQRDTFTKYSIPAPCVWWGVYKRVDGAGFTSFVVVALRLLADGTYAAARPPLAPLPVSIHTCRRTAEDVAGKKTYGCVGTA